MSVCACMCVCVPEIIWCVTTGSDTRNMPMKEVPVPVPVAVAVAVENVRASKANYVAQTHLMS